MKIARLFAAAHQQTARNVVGSACLPRRLHLAGGPSRHHHVPGMRAYIRHACLPFVTKSPTHPLPLHALGSLRRSCLRGGHDKELTHRAIASQLILLSDLENDFINPHDAAHNTNAWVVRFPPTPWARTVHVFAVNARLVPTGMTQLSCDRCIVQMPEYGIQAALVLAMLLSGRWVVLCFHLPVLAYHVRTFALNDYKTDVTEIFRQLPRERRKRIIKLAVYMGGFVFIVYKCDSCASCHRVNASPRRPARRRSRLL